MVLSNALWALLGMTIFALSQWAIIVAISKVVGPVGVGQFSLAMAIVNPVFALFSLQLRAHYATSRSTKYKLAEYAGLRSITSLCAICVSLFCAFYYRTDLTFTLLIVCLCIAKYSESLSDLIYGLNQRFEELRFTSISMMLRGAVGAFFLYLILSKTGSINFAIIALPITWIVVLIFYDFRAANRYQVKITPKINISIFSLIKIAWPMAFAVFISSILINLPRYFISINLNIEQLGLFTVHVYFLSLYCMFSTALSQAASTEMANSIDSDESNILPILYRNVKYVVVVCFASMLVVQMFGNILLTFLYSEQFNNKYLLLIIVIGSSFWASAIILDYGLIALRFLKIRIFIQIIAGISMVACWYLTFEKLGIIAGGYCVVVGGAVQALLNFIVVSSESNTRAE